VLCCYSVGLTKECCRKVLVTSDKDRIVFYQILTYVSVDFVPNKCLISSFRREVDENCSLLGYYAARSSNSLPTFRDNVSVPNSRVKNPRRANRLSRNVGKKIQLLPR
jgi:hypothetical protein